MERAHRKYSPSQADRFFLCPGSTRLCAPLPARRPDEYAEDGTAGHAALQEALEARVREANTPSVQFALDYVYGLLDEYPDAQLFIEEFVNPPLTSLANEGGGFCDVAVFVPSVRRLFIIDYKQGFQRVLAHSRQLYQYATGFLFDDALPVSADDLDAVTLVVLQPNTVGDPLDTHDTTPFEVWEYLQSLDEAIALAEQEDAPLVPGPVQCRYCDARALCPAVDKQVVQLLDPEATDMDALPAEMPSVRVTDVEHLAKVRRHAAMIKKYLSAVDEHCFELLRSGVPVPDAKLVRSSERRRYISDDMYENAKSIAPLIGFNDADAAIDQLKALLEDPVLAQLFRVSLIPLTDAEKKIVKTAVSKAKRKDHKAAASEARSDFSFMTMKVASETLTMVDASDPRPAVNAAGAFAHVPKLIPPPKG